MLSVVSVADPEKPVALSDLANLLSSDDETRPTGPRSPAWGKIAAFAVVCLALTALWKYTPLATFLDGNHITGWARRAGDEWWVPILTVLAYTPVAFTIVSAAADHAVRRDRVRPVAWASCTRCSASSCPPG